MSTTIRVSERTRQRIAELASTSGRQMQAVVDDAVAAYERATFWESFESRYAVLADDPEQWKSIEDERAVEEAALDDDVR